MCTIALLVGVDVYNEGDAGNAICTGIDKRVGSNDGGNGVGLFGGLEVFGYEVVELFAEIFAIV